MIIFFCATTAQFGHLLPCCWSF